MDSEPDLLKSVSDVFLRSSFIGGRKLDEDQAPVDAVRHNERHWEDNSAVLICPEHKSQISVQLQTVRERVKNKFLEFSIIFH